MNLISSSLEHRALRLALELATAEDCRISSLALSNHFGTEAALLIKMGTLRPEGYASAVEARDGTVTTVVWSPERGGPGYFDDEEGWVDLGLGEVGAFSLQVRDLVRCLVAKLDLQPAGTFIELRPGLLWDIGFARLPLQTKRVSIWVARRLHDPDVHAGLRQAALNRPALDHRLVLNLSNAETQSPLMANHAVASVASIVSVTNPLEIDPEIASALLRRPVGRTRAVQMSAEGGNLTVHGREYLFRGTRQRAIIRQLFEAWESGDARLLTQNVLTEAGSGLSVRRLANVFKDHPNWHEVIKEENGLCWLEA